MSTRTRFDVFEQKVKIAGILATVVGVFLLGFEYYTNTSKVQVDRSLRYWENFTTSGMLDVRRRVLSAAFHMEEISRTSKEYDSFLKSAFAAPSGLRADLYFVIEAFNAVYKCVEDDICDKDAATDLFAYHACDLLTRFYSVIKGDVEDEGKGYAAGILFFALHWEVPPGGESENGAVMPCDAATNLTD